MQREELVDLHFRYLAHIQVRAGVKYDSHLKSHTKVVSGKFNLMQIWENK